MKRICIYLFFVSVYFLNACKDNDSELVTEPGQVTFAFVQSDQDQSGRTKSETPAFASLVLKRPDGSAISLKFPLTEFNGSFVTLPQQLVPGHYALEQFFILNSGEQSIYASPVTGSELADLVAHPLPLSFDVTSNQTTTVAPEVLAVKDYPAEDFGYATFAFTVVDVNAIKIPFIENKTIEKIGYQFSNGSETIASEVQTSGTVLNITDPRLESGSWQSKIWVWIASDKCIKEVYRFSGEIAFNGAVIRLPAVADVHWQRLFHERKEIKSGLFADLFFEVDLGKPFRFEIKVPTGTYLRGRVDRTYWNNQDHQICATKYQEFFGYTFLQVALAGPDCETDKIISEVDSSLSFSIINGDNVDREFYFSWKLSANGEMVPVCK